MLRLLRRRQGILLAVFGTVLMILMLADQSIYGLMGRLFSGSGTWATIGDRSISSETRAQLARELEVLDRVGWMGIGAGPLGVIEDPAHWLLLTEMARNAGFTTGSLATEMQEAELAQVYTAAGRTPEVDRALSNLFGVIRMFGAMANSPTLSDRRLIRDASSIFGGADCRLMVLEAQATGDEPSDEAIASHFENYRDVEPSDPEQAFGYRLPDRVAVDWFTLPANVIEDAARTSEAMDTIAVLKHWKTNPRGRAFPAYDASIEVPEVVIDDLLAIETDALFDRVDRRLSSTLLEARRDLKTTPEALSERMNFNARSSCPRIGLRPGPVCPTWRNWSPKRFRLMPPRWNRRNSKPSWTTATSQDSPSRPPHPHLGNPRPPAITSQDSATSSWAL